MEQIMAGPTNWLTDRATRTGGAAIADCRLHGSLSDPAL